MKKKILAIILAIGILSSGNTVFAQDIVNETLSETDKEYSDFVATDDFDYTNPDFDWSKIEHIEVIYLAPDCVDDFIKTAVDNGVEVSFSLLQLPQPRYAYFSSLSWITRDGVVSLSLNPYDPYTIDKEAGWSEAARYFQYHPIYTAISNPSKFMSMYNQYVCHVDFAKGIKTPWNIEPIKPDKGYWQFVASGCN